VTSITSLTYFSCMKKTKSTLNQNKSKHKLDNTKAEEESFNESFFQAMFESHQAVMLLIEPETGMIIDANIAATTFYKYSREELKKLKIQDINQLAPDAVRAEWRKALRDERNYFIFPHKLADGQIRQVEVYSSSFTHLGKPILYSIIHDITEKKQAEEALQKSEEKFEIAFKSNPNALILSAVETGEIFEINDTFCTLTGLVKDEVLGKSSLDIDIYISPDDRQKLVNRLKSKGSIKNYELTIKHRSGKHLCVLLSSEYLETSIGETILTTLQDITERKKLEEQRKKQHDLLQIIFDTVPAMISVYDPEIKEVQLNRELERITGWTSEDTKSKNIMELAYPDPRYRKEVAHYMQSLAPGFKDIVMTCKDGTTKDTLWANVVANDGRRLGIGIDISERKRAQAELQKSQNIISTALASMTDAVYISDAEGKLVEFNDAFFTFYRINSGTLFSRDISQYFSFFDFYHSDGKLAGIEELPISRALKGEKITKTEYTILRKDTGDSWVGSFSFAPIRDHGNTITGSVVVARDITDSKRGEQEKERLIEQLAREKEALAESEDKYRIMGDAVDYGVWAADAEGKVTYLSESFCNLVGKSFEELKEHGWHENLIMEQSQQIMDLWMHCVRTGDPYEHEHKILGKDGDIKHILARARPIRNKEGEIISWAGIHLDITERKIANVQLAEQNKNLTRMNEVLEDFVHIAAHDLRSPIGNLLTINDLIINQSDAAKKMELFSMLKPVIQRLQRTVDGLLEMVSLQVEENISAEKVYFNDVLAELNEVLSAEISTSDCELKVNFSDAPEIRYARVHLVSIFKNLVSNAIKYSTDDYKPVVHITTARFNDYIILTITDNGIGIDLEKVGKNLFKPFQRFTNKAGGTGLGLYIIRSIIEKNGGYIKVESQPEEGTTFYCYLKEFPAEAIS
jgi:PAS domain S-box-containing protein